MAKTSKQLIDKQEKKSEVPCTCKAESMIGDCDRCGHSVMYHVPLIGCAKCSCEEFR